MSEVPLYPPPELTQEEDAKLDGIRKEEKS